MQELANLFYADYSEHGTDSLSLILYGHLFEFQISEASQATQNTGALRFNGQVKASTSAVRLANSVYLPLRPIIEVLGGNIHYVADQQKIIAVTPRPDFLGGRVISSGAADRLILSFSHPVAFRQIQDAILNTVVLTVEASSSQPFWQEEGTYLNLVQLKTLPGQLNVAGGHVSMH